jgi:hypothetical protein
MIMWQVRTLAANPKVDLSSHHPWPLMTWQVRTLAANPKVDLSMKNDRGQDARTLAVMKDNQVPSPSSPSHPHPCPHPHASPRLLASRP